jgi:peroxiredoxin
MGKKLVPGQTAPLIVGQGLLQDEVRVPDSSGRVTHLQFRRFAGCPVCNVHLRSFVRKYDELVGAGIREVVVFHSSREQFKPYQSHYPFEVICDPEKKLYREFGVESSISAIFSWATWKAAFEGMLLPGQPKFVPPPVGGRLALPADFLIATDGKIIDSHYGQHAYDQWSVEEVLARASSVGV